MRVVREQGKREDRSSGREAPLLDTHLNAWNVSSLTYPPDPPHVPHEIREAQNAARQAALGRGEIPQSLLETLLLVPPGSETATTFQETALGMLKRHIPKDFWDFDAKPVRIFLSTSPEPNAFYISGSQPPAIGITAGMFRPCKMVNYTQERFDHLTRGLSDLGLAPGREVTPIQSVSDFASVVMHELIHVQEQEKRGVHANDKLEEFLAYTTPLDAMHRGGLDPRAMYRSMLILLRPDGSPDRQLDRLLDPHPQNDNTLNAIRLALTQLSYERGRVTPLTTPDTAEDTRDLIELARLASLPGPTEIIDRALSLGFAQAGPLEQARELVGLIHGLEEYDWNRAEEIAIRLEAITRRTNDPLAEAQAAILARITDLHPALSTRLYEATQSKAHCEVPAPLRPLDTAMKELRDACTIPTFSQQAIEEASKRLLQTIDSLPILQTNRGRQFTCYQSLTQFRPATRDTVVPWESLRVASAASPLVTEAAIKIGFARDPVIGTHLTRHPGLGNKVLEPTMSEHLAFPYREVSWGPALKMKNREVFLHQGSFSPSKEHEGHLTLHSIDPEGPHPYEFPIPSNGGTSRQDDAQDRAISLALTILNQSPLSDSSPPEQREFVIHLLGIVSEGCEPRFREGQSFIRLAGARLLFLTPSTLCLAPDKVSDIIYGYAQGSTNMSQAVRRQEEIVTCLAAAVRATTTSEVVRNLHLDENHIIPTQFRAKSLCLLPLAVAVLSEQLSLTPQERLSYLASGMSSLISTPADEQLIFNVLHANGLIRSTAPPLVEVLSAITNQDTPWTGRYALTRYALREVCSERDIPSLLLTLIKAEPDDWVSDPFIKGRVTAYERQLIDHVRGAISPSSIAEATEHFSLLNKHNLIPIADRSHLVQKLLEHIDVLPEAEKRLSLRLTLVGGFLDEDYITEERVMREVPNLIRKALGPDDGSITYSQRALALIAPLSEIVSEKRRADLGESISRAMVAQGPLAHALRDAFKGIASLEDDKRFSVACGLDALLLAMQSGHGMQQRRALLRFLSSPWSQASGIALARDIFPPLSITFLENGQDRAKIQRPPSSRTLGTLLSTYEVLVGAYLSKNIFARLRQDEQAIVTEGARSFLALSQAWHRQFADSSLPVKSGVIHQVLFADGLALDEEPHIRRYVAETLAPPHTDHAPLIQRLTHRYLESTPFVKREPLLTGTIVAAWKMGPRATLGRTMVEVACALGPAEVKMVQRIRGHTSVRENIRRDSATAVYQVGEPNRVNLLDWVDQVRNHLVGSYRDHLRAVGRADETISLTHVGEIKGAGSMGVTVKITFSNGDARVLYLVRPFARQRGEAGFGTFQRMAEAMPDSDTSKDVILDLLESAKRRIALEASALTAKVQYDLGIAMYRNKRANVAGESFSFNAPQVLVAEEFTTHGRLHGYFLMEEVPGTPIAKFLLDSSISHERKRTVCTAIVAREFHNYLNFLIEPDRNEGNIFIDGSVIHHLDLKAMRPTPWSTVAKEEIAPFLVNGLMDALKQNQNLAELLSDLGGDRSQLSEEGFELLTELETGLMSLAPYINYLKTEDLQAIALGALDAGIDPILAKAAAKPLPALAASIGERYLKGDRGFLIPSLHTILQTMGLNAYTPLIGKVTLPN
jgi:hypothetical protein